MLVSELILSDAMCSKCGQLIGVHWAFRAIFSVIILAATVVVGLLVLARLGIYAALLMISLPIGAIGFIKARYCPLVIRKHQPGAERSPN